jgi:hypothetical protein
MDIQKMDRKKFVVSGAAVLMALALAFVLPVLAQQQTSQQKQSSLKLEAEPGLPASCTTAVYMQDSGNEISIGKTYSSARSGVIESTVCVRNAGWLTLVSPKISKTGKDGEYGGQAVEAAGGSVVNILNGEIYTDTNMANGIWATNEGSSVYMKGGSITTIARGGHGVDVTKRGSVNLYDVKISTSGSGAAGALVNDAGDGSIYATRVTAHTKGPGSSGFYMIGDKSMLVLNDSSLEAETSEVGVLVHGSMVTITNTAMKGGKAGIKVAGGTLSISGGSLDAKAGDAFYVGGGEGGVPAAGESSGAAGVAPGAGAQGAGAPGSAASGGAAAGVPGAPGGGAPGGMPSGGLMADMPGMREIDSTITVKNGTRISSAGNLINVVGTSKGSFTADGTDLKGNVIVSEKGAFEITLTKSSLTGSIRGASMTLDKDSKWDVTGDSVLTGLSDTAGISGSNIINITGNGHTVSYDRKLEDNKYLGGKTYSLANGGKLMPKQGK